MTRTPPGHGQPGRPLHGKLGSAAAAGSWWVFARPPRPAQAAFDMTAGILVLREVGGVVTDFEGQPVGGVEAGLTDRSTLLCAASPGMHERALASLHGV